MTPFAWSVAPIALLVWPLRMRTSTAPVPGPGYSSGLLVSISLSARTRTPPRSAPTTTNARTTAIREPSRLRFCCCPGVISMPSWVMAWSRSCWLCALARRQPGRAFGVQRRLEDDDSRSLVYEASSATRVDSGRLQVPGGAHRAQPLVDEPDADRGDPGRQLDRVLARRVRSRTGAPGHRQRQPDHHLDCF